jgi:hypothetical protein
MGQVLSTGIETGHGRRRDEDFHRQQVESLTDTQCQRRTRHQPRLFPQFGESDAFAFERRHPRRGPAVEHLHQ